MPAHLRYAGATYKCLARWAEPSAARELGVTLGSKSFWIATIGAAVLVNAIDYGWGSKADVGIGSSEFYAAVTVDLALGAGGVGSGALTAYGLYLGAMWLCPQFAVPALVLGYLVGQTFFAWVVAPSLRQPGIEGVNWFYARAMSPEGQIVYHGSPLLR